MMTNLEMSGEKLDVKLMKSNLEASNYAAMAFSCDRKMGKDLVFACNPSWENLGSKEVRVYVNTESYTPSEFLYENDGIAQNQKVYYYPPEPPKT